MGLNLDYVAGFTGRKHGDRLCWGFRVHGPMTNLTRWNSEIQLFDVRRAQRPPIRKYDIACLTHIV